MTDHNISAVAGIGHNKPPPYVVLSEEIDGLYIEAKNWADGEPIADQATADAITKLHDMLHDAGKRAEEARKDEAKPFDDGKAEVQARYNKLIGNTKSAKGKVVLGKEALQALLTPWRRKLEDEARAAAAAARAEAEKIAADAQAALRASRGDLEAREEAEELLQDAKQAERWAKRVDRQATTNTGLRSVWHADMVDAEAALEWAYGREPERFTDVAQQIADEQVRAGLRVVPGFAVREDRVAR